MGCASLKQSAKQQIFDVMKAALTKFKQKVQTQTKIIESTRQGPLRQLKRIQAMKNIVNSLEEQLANFFDHFKNQKYPTNLIYSTDAMKIILDQIWNDHNQSISNLKKMQQRVAFWLNAAKNIQQSQELLHGKKIQQGPNHHCKQNSSYQIDKIDELEALDTKIALLNAIIQKNQRYFAQKQTEWKKEQRKLIEQNEKNIQDINNLAFQLKNANIQLTNNGTILQKGRQNERRIAKHQAQLAELQKGLREKAIQEDALNKKIQKIQQEKNTLQKRLKELQTTPTPEQFTLYNPDQQLRAENQSLITRLRQTKDELGRLKRQSQNPTSNGNTSFIKSSENETPALKMAKQEIQQLQSTKFKLEEQIRQKDRNLSDLQSEISRLKSQINSLNAAKKEYELKLLQNRTFIESIKSKNGLEITSGTNARTSDPRSKQDEILKKTQQIALLEAQFRKIQQELHSKEEEHEHNLMELQSLKNKVQKLSAELRKTETSISSANTTRLNNEKEIFSLKQSLSLKERETYQLNNQLKTLREQINTINSQWESRIKQEQNKLRQNEQSQRKLLAELKNCKSIIQNQQNDKNQSEQVLRNHNQLQTKLSLLENENVSLKKSLQNSIDSFNKEKQILSDTFRAKQIEAQRRFDQQKGNLVQQIGTLKYESQSKNRELSQINQKFKEKCSEVQTLKSQKLTPSKCYTQYFCGSILNYKSPQYTQWFVQSLENSVKKTVKATYPVYKFDRNNKTSFHAYIDNKPQIVLVVRMTNGQIIAGYSEPPFKPKTNADFRTGFIFAFKNRKIFTVKKEATNKFNRTPPKPINYDEHYLSWGNSDIRITSGSDELYSAYATPNSSYEERGNNDSVVDDLLLQEERLTTLHDYELFQVEFEDE